MYCSFILQSVNNCEDKNGCCTNENLVKKDYKKITNAKKMKEKRLQT